jgi:hypothetical protein
VFAADEAALPIEAIAIGLVARGAENLDRVRAGIEAVQAVAWNVAEDEDAVLSAPNGTFSEAKSARAPRHWLVADDARQPRVANVQMTHERGQLTQVIRKLGLSRPA